MDIKEILGIILGMLILLYGVVGSITIWRATDLSCKNLILPCVKISIEEKK